jgi:hypothetical protein
LLIALCVRDVLPDRLISADSVHRLGDMYRILGILRQLKELVA